jgi:hypothetical protein
MIQSLPSGSSQTASNHLTTDKLSCHHPTDAVPQNPNRRLVNGDAELGQ